MPVTESKELTLGVLAGGEGRRFGGRDKGLLEYQGQTFIGLTLHALRAHGVTATAEVMVSANRNQADYRQYGLVVADRRQGFCGPLAGIEAMLLSVETDFLLCVPCDLLFPPANYVEALLAQVKKTGIKAAYLHDGLRAHYTCLLLHRELVGSITAYLDEGGRSVKGWLATRVDATTATIEEPISNINSLQQLQEFDACR